MARFPWSQPEPVLAASMPVTEGPDPSEGSRRGPAAAARRPAAAAYLDGRPGIMMSPGQIGEADSESANTRSPPPAAGLQMPRPWLGPDFAAEKWALNRNSTMGA